MKHVRSLTFPCGLMAYALPWVVLPMAVCVIRLSLGLQEVEHVTLASSMEWLTHSFVLWSTPGGFFCVLANIVTSKIIKRAKITADDVLLWLTLAGTALLLLSFTLPPAFTRAVYTYGDLAHFHLPIRHFYAQSLAAGDTFTWWPNLFCGFYVHAEGQGGLYHPLHLFLYRFLPLDVAFNFEVIVNYPAMYLGTFVFLRRWTLPPGSASLGAFTFAFSGPVFLRFNHVNAIAITAHLPWLLFLLDTVLRGSNKDVSRFSLIGIAMLTGSQLLLGYPQYFWFSALAEAVFACCILTYQRDLGSLAATIVFKTLGVLIGCLQLIPTWHALQSSDRSEAGVSALAVGSLHPVNFMQFLFPYLFDKRVLPGASEWEIHEFGIYIGTVPILLCIAHFISRRSGMTPRPLVLFSAILLSVSLLLALGKYSPLFSVLVNIPLVGMFRASARYMVLASFSLSILTAIASCSLIERQSRSKSSGTNEERIAFHRVPLWAAGFSLMAAVIVALLLRLLYRQSDQTLAYSVSKASLLTSTLLLLLPVFLLSAWSLRLQMRVVLIGLISFHVIDVCVYDLTFLASGGPYPRDGRPVRIEMIQMPLEEHTVRRIDGHRVAGQGTHANRLTLRQIRLATGYVGLSPRKRLDYRDEESCRAAGVTLFWNGTEWKWLDRPFPPVWIGEPLLDDSPAVDAKARRTQATGMMWCPPRKHETESAHMTARSNGQVTIEVEAVRSGILVWQESFHPGWRVKVDGRAETAMPVCGDFIGCRIMEGSHTVNFSFAPSDLRVGKCATATGLAIVTASLTVIVAGVLCRCSGRRGDAPPQAQTAK